MKKFYEIRMKSGRTFIASTNKNGVCQFTINENEFTIYSGGSSKQNFTFSVENNQETEDFENNQHDQGLEVVSLQEIVVKKKWETKNIYRNLEELRTHTSKIKRTFLRWKENYYYAKHGGLQTPDGWIFGSVT